MVTILELEPLFLKDKTMKNIILFGALGAALVGCSNVDTCDTSATPVSVEQAAVPGSSADFSKNVKDKVFFGFDQYKISPEAMPSLNDQATWLKLYSSAKVTIEGNCDSRGTDAYNLGLGERRAKSVKDALVKLGVSADRISTISFGKEKAAPGTDVNTHALNRNATTVVGG